MVTQPKEMTHCLLTRWRLFHQRRTYVVCALLLVVVCTLLLLRPISVFHEHQGKSPAEASRQSPERDPEILLEVADRLLAGPTLDTSRARQGYVSERMKFLSQISQPKDPRRDRIFPSEAGFDPALCSLDTCFDMLSKWCALNGGFPVYFYRPEDFLPSSLSFDDFWSKDIGKMINNSRHSTDDFKKACLVVIVLGDASGEVSKEKKSALDDAKPAEILEHYLRSMPSWRKDGRNHVIINLSGDHTVLNEMNAMQSMIASPCFATAAYRPEFDIIIPTLPRPLADSTPSETSARVGDAEAWSEPPPIDPAFRKSLLSFHAQLDALEAGEEKKDAIASALQVLEKVVRGQNGDAKVDIVLSCILHPGANPGQKFGDWDLCGSSAQAREAALVRATFSLVLAPLNETMASSTAFQTRLSEALKSGAVPVVVGSSLHRRLPYSELIRWEEAVILLPFQRLLDLPEILLSFTADEITRRRLRGRFLWENYFSSARKIVDTVQAVIRTRLRILAPTAREEKSVSYFDSTGDVRKKSGTQRFASETFVRNFTTTLTIRSFNQPGDPFSLFPSTPYDSALSTTAKAWGAQLFPIGPLGDDPTRPQVHFSATLLGNTPQEQFTIVILTYKRLTSLLALLNRLKGLSFLNKVVIVWNDPTPPPSSTIWPDIGVPIQVLKSPANSLNNRFLPFDCIETDAIFSMDDDVDIDHDRIVLGFKVWRSERDRIVGFFFRYHLWNGDKKRWEYSWGKYPGEVSIAITSAAFYHKYYNYLYSQVMPRQIRDHVTQKMNCEDIAMNFLIAHVTRKPPIRVAWKWKFSVCGGRCSSESISGHSDHLEKRHQCTDYFAKVYGYMPLLFTCYSVDFLPDYA